MQASSIWAYYLWKPWAPLHLSPVYTSLLSFNPLSAPFLASAGLVVGLTALLWWKRRQWPWALGLWICHLVLLAPALGLAEHPHYSSDRYSYIPGILWSVLLAAAWLRLCDRPRLFASAMAASLALVAVLGVMSFRQTRIWRDSASLFEYTLATAADPANRDGREAVQRAEQACLLTGQQEARLVGTLAAAYAEAGRFAEAATTAEKAARLAEQTSQPELAARNRKLLELYRAGKPARDAP